MNFGAQGLEKLCLRTLKKTKTKEKNINFFIRFTLYYIPHNIPILEKCNQIQSIFTYFDEKVLLCTSVAIHFRYTDTIQLFHNDQYYQVTITIKPFHNYLQSSLEKTGLKNDHDRIVQISFSLTTNRYAIAALFKAVSDYPIKNFINRHIL